MDDAAPKFLIVRLSHIGDCVLTLPLAAAIKRAIPGATVVWATEKAAVPLLELHPAVDRIETVPTSWLKRPGCWDDLRSRLRRERFDWVLDPQSLLKSSALAWLSGSPRRVGFDGRFGREFSRWIHNIRVETNHTHLLERTLDLLRPPATHWPGLLGQPVDFRLPVCSSADRVVSDWLASEQIGRFTILNPGASWPSKQWSSARFGAVARSLRKDFGIASVVTWAGAGEFEMAEEIFEVSDRAVHVAPATSLRQFAALAARASLFIGCDTGPMHIAAASGCRCLVLHGPTRPEDSGAWGHGHRALQKWLQTGGHRARRGASNAAMLAITVDDVLEEASQMLAVEAGDVRPGRWTNSGSIARAA